jgi:oligopeptide/dipeptide ABC transporter ATP-binding protein
MRQRAMIAMSLALNPKLLIADEPTTALDVTVQAQIIDLIERLQAEFNTAVIMITHDLGVVADNADDVMVMYAGKPVEFADRRTLYYRPHHPYTKGLIESIPSAEGERGRLKPIQGQPPSLIRLPSGCSFHPRCPYVMDQCVTDIPPLRQVAGSADHRSACWLPVDEVGLGGEVDRKREEIALARRGALAAESADIIDDDDVPDGSAADVPAEAVKEDLAGEANGRSGRPQALAGPSTREVRARTGQPAPPARPQRRTADGASAPAAKKVTAKKIVPAKKSPSKNAPAAKSATKATGAAAKKILPAKPRRTNQSQNGSAS